jgi:hypothetical protein
MFQVFYFFLASNAMLSITIWLMMSHQIFFQIEMYAQFLETVTTESDRRLALTLAIESNLPIDEIKIKVVQNIFR